MPCTYLKLKTRPKQLSGSVTSPLGSQIVSEYASHFHPSLIFAVTASCSIYHDINYDPKWLLCKSLVYIPFSIVILPNLELKTWPKQHLGSGKVLSRQISTSCSG